MDGTKPSQFSAFPSCACYKHNKHTAKKKKKSHVAFPAIILYL